MYRFLISILTMSNGIFLSYYRGVLYTPDYIQMPYLILSKRRKKKYLVFQSEFHLEIKLFCSLWRNIDLYADSF